jgi:hypothetical protein
MVQIGLVFLGLLAFWEGSKGFRSTGIKIGLVSATSAPITGATGKLIGSFVIGVGIVCLFFALVYIPFMSGAR